MPEIKAIVGGVNTTEEQVLDNVRRSIRRHLPQLRRYQEQDQAVSLVAGGPSLNQTLIELRDCTWRGQKIVTVNGSYGWCIAHNLKPSMAIVLDARPENAEFLAEPVEGCKYFLASQCDPEAFDIVEGRDVYIFHALSYYDAEKRILDKFYKGCWEECPRGTTVTLRALSILRMLGFLRIDVFGFDSCWMGDRHHAYPQTLNDSDQCLPITLRVDGKSDREFFCAPWHLRQLEDFKGWVQSIGGLVDLRVHGDGLIAHYMRTGARLVEESRPREITVEAV